MAVIVEPVISAQDALPVCLCAWRENPYRLVSLWDIVKPFYAALITSLSFNAIRAAGDLDESISKAPIPSDTKELIKDAMPSQREHCAGLGLIASIASIDRITAIASNQNATWGQLDALNRELQSRLHDELKGTFFLSLTTSESDHYNKWYEGWEEIIKRFSVTITDIEEMSKCFALARYAGAVFHSVQTIECGLIELGKFLNVTDPKSGWTAVTKRLESLVVKTKYTDLVPLYQQHFAFLEQMHGTVGSLNSAWRNKISHAQGRLVLMTSEFSPQIAEEILLASRSFMRRLATELPI